MSAKSWIALGFVSMAWAALPGPSVAQSLEYAVPIREPAGQPIADAKHPWLITTLSQVPEIHFQKVEPLREPVLAKDMNTLTAEEQDKLQKIRAEATRRITDTIANVNKGNEPGTDHFMKDLVKSRLDLAGLPWVMGDACRTKADRSSALVREVAVIRSALRLNKSDVAPIASATKIEKLPWERYDLLVENLNAKLPMAINKDELPPARVAALMQILGPASASVRQEMVARIAKVKEADATRALARLAIFSAEREVRDAALAALKDRNKQEYTPILLQGLRYPWPTVAKNAGTALVALACKDQVPTLVAFLDEPDPRAPIAMEGKTPTVREVVKLNHHHNCLLCHAPINPKDAQVSPSAVVLAEIPSPAQPLPSQSMGYKSKKAPLNLAIRVDVTYLRQDFSLLQSVADTAPWPEMQRFDYLVREREVGAREVRAYQDWAAKAGADYVSANHQAALAALRELTGRNAAPTAQAWRKVLEL